MLKEWESELRRSELDTTNMSLFQCLDIYIDHIEQSKAVELSTIAGYKTRVTLIKNIVSDIKLKHLTVAKAQDILNELSQHYQSATTRSLKVLCSLAIKWQIINGNITFNAFSSARPPKQSRIQPNALTEESREKLKQYIEKDPTNPRKAGIAISLYTGMRIGEVLGLQFKDIDLNSRVLWVNRSIANGYGEHNCYIKAPKTDKKRDIPITDNLMGILNARREYLIKQCNKLGVPFTNTLYVLGDCSGNLLTYSTLRYAFNKAVKDLGLTGVVNGKKLVFHDLRHTFATIAIAGGIDVKTVSSILGHARASMTLDIYASSDPNAKRQAGLVLDKLI